MSLSRKPNPRRKRPHKPPRCFCIPPISVEELQLLLQTSPAAQILFDAHFAARNVSLSVWNQVYADLNLQRKHTRESNQPPPLTYEGGLIPPDL
ncbi:unnamed protein product [marine sediment metagenome]|uniref:Uncharacterized protein n=1 Tax=marine sediment metagenome TaxID=412755 RepID=X1SMR5_9ZZZZ